MVLHRRGLRRVLVLHIHTGVLPSHFLETVPQIHLGPVKRHILSEALEGGPELGQAEVRDHRKGLEQNGIDR